LLIYNPVGIEKSSQKICTKIALLACLINNQ
ncbi:MAG: hypothetical protein ACI9WM_000519, partial [Arenicella sp.]